MQKNLKNKQINKTGDSTKITGDSNKISNKTVGTTNKKRIGQVGESAAVAYLKHKGHEILGRNIRLRRGEIDILTKKDTTLHVVEVKTALIANDSVKNIILPEEKFSKQKINRLKYLANAILARYSKGNFGVQIDGIAIRIYSIHGKKVPSSIDGINKITARFYEAIS